MTLFHQYVVITFLPKEKNLPKDIYRWLSWYGHACVGTSSFRSWVIHQHPQTAILWSAKNHHNWMQLAKRWHNHQRSKEAGILESLFPCYLQMNTKRQAFMCHHT